MSVLSRVPDGERADVRAGECRFSCTVQCEIEGAIALHLAIHRPQLGRLCDGGSRICNDTGGQRSNIIDRGAVSNNNAQWDGCARTRVSSKYSGVFSKIACNAQDKVIGQPPSKWVPNFD